MLGAVSEDSGNGNYFRVKEVNLRQVKSAKRCSSLLLDALLGHPLDTRLPSELSAVTEDRPLHC